MNSGSLLDRGDSFSLAASGASCQVESLLGVGGQGEVFEVSLRTDGPLGSYAFKCYHPHVASEDQWLALATLVDLGSPTARFLWPQDLAHVPQLSTFGYLMSLREERFRGLVDLVKRLVSTRFSTLTLAAFQLADSFLALHSRGLCYRDISLGNVFIDIQTGDVLICDNDNVAVDGLGHQSVLGTTGFMAPEVERMEAVPSIRTDLHSLAVLLFLMFINHHPLIGLRELEYRSLDQRSFRELYGTHPTFIFDPDDEANRPVAGVHDNALLLWPLYPRAFQRLFITAFTAGLRDPINGRVRESTWKTGLARLRDSIVRCSCGAEAFYDDELKNVASAPPGSCWSCQRHVDIPPLLRTTAGLVILNDDTAIYPHHVGGDLYDYTEPVGRVTPHPRDPSIRGLMNVSHDSWMAQESDGSAHMIEPGRTVRLADGMHIRFPRLEAVVEA